MFAWGRVENIEGETKAEVEHPYARLGKGLELTPTSFAVTMRGLEQGRKQLG